MGRANSIEEYRAEQKKVGPTGERIRKVRMANVGGGVVRPFPTEHEEQVALFAWALRAQVTYPELKLLYAIANAGAGAQRGQAGKMKAEGVKRGVPDTCLPVAKSGYHGVYIEMKAQEGRISPEQAEWVSDLTKGGYYAVVAYGFVEARDHLLNYLRGDVPDREVTPA